MTNPDIRAELRAIQVDLKKPLPASAHKIRELPGKGYWAFVPHQIIRQRLDEVAPDWESSFSRMEVISDTLVCRCSIVILGVRKEAVGSVPLVAAEKNGKDVSRGSAADRVSAEALKNAAEMWGVGVYLDDQAFVANYLNKNSIELNDEMRAKLRSLIAYLRSKGEIPPTNSSVSLSPIPKTQQTTIKKPVTPVESSPQPLPKTLVQKPNVDRGMLMQETTSLCSRKYITEQMGQDILMQLYGVKGRSQLSDEQLLGFRDYLASAKSQEPQAVK